MLTYPHPPSPTAVRLTNQLRARRFDEEHDRVRDTASIKLLVEF